MQHFAPYASVLSGEECGPRFDLRMHVNRPVLFQSLSQLTGIHFTLDALMDVALDNYISSNLEEKHILSVSAKAKGLEEGPFNVLQLIYMLLCIKRVSIRNIESFSASGGIEPLWQEMKDHWASKISEIWRTKIWENHDQIDYVVNDRDHELSTDLIYYWSKLLEISSPGLRKNEIQQMTRRIEAYRPLESCASVYGICAGDAKPWQDYIELATDVFSETVNYPSPLGFGTDRIFSSPKSNEIASGYFGLAVAQLRSQDSQAAINALQSGLHALPKVLIAIQYIFFTFVLFCEFMFLMVIVCEFM